MASQSDTVSPKEKTDVKVTQHVKDLKPQDVLMGRGLGPNEHQGNISFREIVSSYRPEYLATNIRKEKDKIAHKTIKAIKAKNGRFLRKLGEDEVVALGVKGPVYVAVDQKIVLEKIKQALRFQRRKKDVSTRGEEGQKRSEAGEKSREGHHSRSLSNFPALDQAARATVGANNAFLHAELAGQQDISGLDYALASTGNMRPSGASQFQNLNMASQIPREHQAAQSNSLGFGFHQGLIPRNQMVSQSDLQSQIARLRGTADLANLSRTPTNNPLDWRIPHSAISARVPTFLDTAMLGLRPPVSSLAHSQAFRATESFSRPRASSDQIALGAHLPTPVLRVSPNIPTTRPISVSQLDFLDASHLVSDRLLRLSRAQHAQAPLTGNDSAITAALRQPNATSEASLRLKNDSA